MGGAEKPGLSFDGEPTSQPRSCSECGGEHQLSVGFVLRNGAAHAVYWANWHPHTNEAYVDAAFGSFIEPDYPDNVTFGCRIGLVEGGEGPMCSLVLPATNSDSAILGKKLSRDDALQHATLAEFWELIDWLMLNDPLLHASVYHMDHTQR